MKLPTPLSPHNTPAEAGWGAQGVFGMSKGLGLSLACACVLPWDVGNSVPKAEMIPGILLERGGCL